jgi:hypothetical protein
MKIATNGSKLWTRTIGSTVFGQAVDSALFYPLAFYAADGWTGAQVMQVAWTQWAIKVSWEVILTPATYWVVGFLKKREGVEVFDTDTSFSPLPRRRRFKGFEVWPPAGKGLGPLQSHEWGGG